MTTPKPVSIHPDAFSDETDLSVLSLEEVVSRFKSVERQRTAKADLGSEAEIQWHIRSAPSELPASLRVVAAQLGIPRSVLTRCMSRHLADWFDRGLGLDTLLRDYNEVYTAIRSRAYSTLRYQADHPAEFCFVGRVESCDTTLSTITWVMGKLTELREFLGIQAHDLFALGLMWSLTTLSNQDWEREVVDKFFAPEVFNFETLVADRRADIVALRAKFDYRERVGYRQHIFVKEAA